MKKIISRILVLLLALSMTAPALATEIVEVGKTAPDFELELLAGNAVCLNEDGTETDPPLFRLSDQIGKVVLINFWATWCPMCVMEMPDLEALSQTYQENLVVIGIDSGETPDVVMDFLEENGYTYNFAIDVDYELITGQYPTSGIPYTVVVDPNGYVTAIKLGAASYDELEAYVQDAMLVTGGE